MRRTLVLRKTLAQWLNLPLDWDLMLTAASLGCYLVKWPRREKVTQVFVDTYIHGEGGRYMFEFEAEVQSQ